MTDRCLVPPSLRKSIGRPGIGKQECLQKPRSCWDARPLHDAPSCYRDGTENPCAHKKGCDTKVGEACFKQIWHNEGCTAPAPDYDEFYQKMSKEKLHKEIRRFANQTDKFHFEKCYGSNQNKSGYCSNSVPKQCVGTVNPKGMIIKCEECEKHGPTGIWLYKDGKRVWLPECSCPAATKAAKVKNTIESNICGTPVSVPKPIKKYSSQETKCTAAWKPCNTTEDCCPGRECREGDKRCLTQNEFDWANWVNKTERSGTIITKHGKINSTSVIFGTDVDNVVWTKPYTSKENWNALHRGGTSYQVANGNKDFVWSLAGSTNAGGGNYKIYYGKREQAVKGGWTSVSGGAVQISAGASQVWVVNKLAYIYIRPVNGSGDWKKLPGRLTTISATGKKYVWGINKNNDNQCAWKCPHSSPGSWQKDTGHFKQISAGQGEVWAIGAAKSKKPKCGEKPTDGCPGASESCQKVYKAGYQHCCCADDGGCKGSHEPCGSLKTGWNGSGNSVEGFVSGSGSCAKWKVADDYKNRPGASASWCTANCTHDPPAQFCKGTPGAYGPQWCECDGGGDDHPSSGSGQSGPPGSSDHSDHSDHPSGSKHPAHPSSSDHSDHPSGSKHPAHPSSSDHPAHPSSSDHSRIDNNQYTENSVWMKSEDGSNWVEVPGQELIWVDAANPDYIFGIKPDNSAVRLRRPVKKGNIVWESIGGSLKNLSSSMSRDAIFPTNLGQTTEHASDCDLVKAWNDPSSKWYYHGAGVVPGLPHGDSTIFYTTKDNVVTIPGGKCEVSCGSERFNICDELNAKIKSCKSDTINCRQATHKLETNPFHPTDLSPKCFYSIPIESGDGVSRHIHQGKSQIQIQGLKCEKSDLFNPNMVDTGFMWNGQLHLFKGSNVYRFTGGQDGSFRLQEGDPVAIKDIFKGVPSDLDAAEHVVFGTNKAILFFRGEHFYKYDEESRRVTKQGNISDTWLNVPGGIDECTWNGQHSKLVFFKGSLCYLVDSAVPQLYGGYQLPNSQDQLFLADPHGGGIYGIDSQESAKQICEQLGGVLASRNSVASLTTTSNPIVAAGWTDTDKQYTYFIQNKKLVKCWSGICVGKGHAWCQVNPSELVIGGTAQPRPISVLYPGCPDYVDCVFINDGSVCVLKGKHAYRTEKNSNHVQIDPRRLISQVYEGLPPFKNLRGDISEKLCTAQHEMQQKVDKAKTDYNTNSSLLSRGYNALQKAQLALKKQARNIYQNDQDLNKLKVSIETETRQQQIGKNATYLRESFLSGLKVVLIGLLAAIIVALTRNSGKVGFLKGKLFYVALGVIFLVAVIHLMRIFYPYTNASAVRWSLRTWDYDVDKIRAEGSGKGGGGDGDEQESTLEKQCKELKQEEERLKREEEKAQSKGFRKIVGKKVFHEGAHWLTKNGQYQGKILDDFMKAKHLAESINGCDGISKSKVERYYELFQLKDSLATVSVKDSNNILYIKESCHYLKEGLGKAEHAIGKVGHDVSSAFHQIL